MKNFTTVIQECSETGMYIAHLPSLVGAHAQGETLEELYDNLKEVLELIHEDGSPQIDAEFIGIKEISLS
ncbi:MAG: type II toxin-antitoxin system HicB family antitoxin [Gammaproteobacteria bacterium]|nr:type II toxin-antitoxin system HicB family antitoxin [Gammaproteobacteria bacterium]